MATNTPDFNWPIPEDTDLVKDGAEAIRDLALAIESTVSAKGSKRIKAFTASGTWTVPAGVTYAIAHMLGGGGGTGTSSTGGDGGNSTVAFADGTVTGPGSIKVTGDSGITDAVAGKANSGQSSTYSRTGSGSANGGDSRAYTVAGAPVTPAASITVTVGAGGAAGTSGAAGGSGYVYIEYYE
jgi:hypothetical protein